MITIHNLNKQYPGFTLSDINLQVNQGEYFVLLGRSGSGKSVLMQLIAGFRKADQGKILLGGREITRERIQHRNVILLHQDTNLFPHMSVFDNIAYPLRCRKQSRQQIREQVHEMAEVVSVSDLLHRYPGGLSGGEAQRVALARALVVQPDLLLLDEPLVALDVQLHAGMKSLLYKINKLGQTILHVTHDYAEAVSLADRMAVIDHGVIQQVGTSMELEQSPQSDFVARLAGIANFYRVSLTSDAASAVPEGCVMVNGIPVRVDSAMLRPATTNAFLIIERGYAEVHLEQPSRNIGNLFEGTVVEVIPGAPHYEVVVDAGFRITAPVGREEVRTGIIGMGSRLWVTFPPEGCRVVNES